jgi:hypothetical protein
MPFRLLGELVNSPLVLDSSARYLDSSVRYLDRPCKRGILFSNKTKHKKTQTHTTTTQTR